MRLIALLRPLLVLAMFLGTAALAGSVPGGYVWPTDASTHLTSSFAEYRTTHFHGGIDISTNGQKGYKVFAVNSGYVCRIRITPNGYGKMLFVRHGDGRISTYAHLQTFNEAINRVTRAGQYRRGTYAIDSTLPAGALPVQRGEVIAYTGDTGFGPPHLHFEMRDSLFNPINPITTCNYAIEDNLPPVIRRVLISPLTVNSTVDNKSTPKILSRFPRRHQSSIIPQKLTIHGEIGFGVEAQDRLNGTSSRAGIHTMQLTIDDSVTFAMHLDRVPADDTKEIDLHYDFPMILEGWGKFQKLYVEPGNSLPFYDNQPERAGIINTDHLTEGKHDYRIVCKDFSGNQAELTGSLLVNHSPTIRLLSVDEDAIVLGGLNLRSVDKISVFGRKLSNPNWSQHTLARGRFEEDGTGIEVPVNTAQYDILRVVAETKWASHTAPIIHFMRKPHDAARPVYVKTEILNDYVRFTVTSTGMFTEPPRLSVKEGPVSRAVEAEPVDLYTYTGIFVPTATYAGKRTLEAATEVNGHTATSSSDFELYSIPTGSRGGFTANPTGLRFSFDSGAVYKPIHIQVSSENFRQSIVYTLEPRDQLINGGIHVSVPFDPAGEAKSPALYFRATGNWIFQTAQPDAGGHTFSTTLKQTLGELAIMSDDAPPSIGRLRCLPRKGKVFFSFRYADNLSGVDTDEIKTYIDDAPVIPEIDGEHRLVSYQADEPLNRGKHSVKITMKDRTKNETSASRTFTIR